MAFPTAFTVAQSLLSLIDLKMFTYYEDRLPQEIPVIVVSNHRSFLDAAILIQALNQPLRIACHHYMGKTPILREMVDLLGCFPLAEAQHRQKDFFTQANNLLTARQWVGLFPEGTQPMVEITSSQQVGKFQRGFAHLAWRIPVPQLAILPVAIASLSETIYPTIPIRFLRWFDATEPFFDRKGLHPMVVYHRVNVLIGHPYSITSTQRQDYQGKQAKLLATDLTNYCREQIIDLLQVGCV
jgi:1-acyl-sn-glycerol-3-phosphate acyltransferase